MRLAKDHPIYPRLILALSTFFISPYAYCMSDYEYAVGNPGSLALLGAGPKDHLLLDHVDLTIKCKQDTCHFATIYKIDVKKSWAKKKVIAIFMGGNVGSVHIGKKKMRLQPFIVSDKAIGSTKKSRKKFQCEAKPNNRRSYKGFYIPRLRKGFQKITVRGTFPVSEQTEAILSGWAVPGGLARHPIDLYQFPRSAIAFNSCFDLWPLASWRGKKMLNVSIHLPSDAKKFDIQFKDYPSRSIAQTEISNFAVDGKNPEKITFRYLDTKWKNSFLMGPQFRFGFGKHYTFQRYGLGVAIPPTFNSRDSMFLTMLSPQVSFGYHRSDRRDAAYVNLDISMPVFMFVFPSISFGAGVLYHPDDLLWEVRAGIHLWTVGFDLDFNSERVIGFSTRLSL